MTKNRCTYEENGCKMAASEESAGTRLDIAPGMAANSSKELAA